MSDSHTGNAGKYSQLQKRLGHEFSDLENLKLALTHASALSGSRKNDHYERLEFLGDRVLGLCIASLLFESFPKEREGDLNLRFTSLVDRNTLSEIADEIGLFEFIRTGGGLKKSSGKRMQNIKADVLEAVIAAIHLDGGLEASSSFISHWWKRRIANSSAVSRSSKTTLQEWAHAQRLGTPTYREVSRSGPDHAPQFSIEVSLADQEPARGEGRTKQDAEQDAARQLLIREGVWGELAREKKTP